MESASIPNCRTLQKLMTYLKKLLLVLYAARRIWILKWFAHSPWKKQLLCVYVLEI